MEIAVNKQNDFTIIAITGRMDAVSAPDFETKIKEEIDSGANKVVVDLSNLEYISSAGLRSMLILYKSLENANGVFVLCGLSGVVHEVFKISGFISIFTICDTVEQAIQTD